MSICTTPELIQAIDIDECIGSSLIKLTTNTSLIETEICTSINDVQRLASDFQTFTSGVTSLSSTKDRFAKATVVFNGNSLETGTGLRAINTSYNVASVSSLDIGTYAIYFDPPLTNNNYAFIGSAALATVHPTLFTSASAVINIRNQSGLVDSDYISILVYNN